MVSATSFTCIVAWVRLYSGSIWPAAIAHAAFNAVIDYTFVFTNKGGELLLGETGLLTALILAIVAVLLFQLWPLREVLLSPDQAMGEQGKTRQVSPGYRLVGALVILAGLVTLIQADLTSYSPERAGPQQQCEVDDIR